MNISLIEELFISALVALVTMLAVNMFRYSYTNYCQRQRVIVRLARLARIGDFGTPGDEMVSIWQLPAVYWLKTKSGKKFTDKAIKAKLKMSALDAAGKMFLLLFTAIAVGILILHSFLSAIILAFCIYFIHIMWLQKRIKNYQRRFVDQLAPTLILIANSLSSGSSLNQALEYAARESRPPIKDELLNIVEQLGVGVSLDQALEKLYQEMTVPELETVISALIIQRRVGGNLAKLLKRTSELLREKNNLKNELLVQTAQSRFSGKIIGLMPVVVVGFLLMADREFIAPLFTTGLGMAILSLSTVAELMGFLLIRRILDISF